MNVLEFNGVSKHFGEIAVLPAVSFQLAEGRALALWGPTGCGKTTLLRIVAGLAEADAGQIAIGGRIAPPARGIGMVFQDLALWPHMTARRHLDYVLRASARDRAERQSLLNALLAEFDLKEHADNRPSELSRGQRQRLAIARALANDPALLLLDEPVSSQHDASIAMILNSLLARKTAGRAIVVASHSREFLRALADDVLVFEPDSVRLAPAADFFATE